MKTTEQLISPNYQDKIEEAMTKKPMVQVAFGAKSVRPQKSMVRVKSLKPNKLIIGKKVNSKKLLVK